MIKLHESYGTMGARLTEYPDLYRMYERLRKASYRSNRTRSEHKSYVAGVRDALNTIAAEYGTK